MGLIPDSAWISHVHVIQDRGPAKVKVGLVQWERSDAGIQPWGSKLLGVQILAREQMKLDRARSERVSH